MQNIFFSIMNLGIVPDILDEIPKAAVTVTVDGKALQPGEQTYTSAVSSFIVHENICQGLRF